MLQCATLEAQAPVTTGSKLRHRDCQPQADSNAIRVPGWGIHLHTELWQSLELITALLATAQQHGLLPAATRTMLYNLCHCCYSILRLRSQPQLGGVPGACVYYCSRPSSVSASIKLTRALATHINCFSLFSPVLAAPRLLRLGLQAVWHCAV